MPVPLAKELADQQVAELDALDDGYEGYDQLLRDGGFRDRRSPSPLRTDPKAYARSSRPASANAMTVSSIQDESPLRNHLTNAFDDDLKNAESFQRYKATPLGSDPPVLPPLENEAVVDFPVYSQIEGDPTVPDGYWEFLVGDYKEKRQAVSLEWMEGLAEFAREFIPGGDEGCVRMGIMRAELW
eukprot:Hpha_TRINITY_DN10258_c0_g1::TRINITY_DN10258_c0_g1_i1::g.35062::m.35062